MSHPYRALPLPVDDRRRGPTIAFAQGAFEACEAVLREHGKNRREEGVVFLAGHSDRDAAVVTTAVAPRATTTFGSFSTDLEANGEVVRRVRESGLILVGQAHTHPGAWVDHSEGDDTGAILKFSGFWSIVVPHFGIGGMQPLDSCGWHVFGQSGFARLSSAAVARRVRLVGPMVDLRRAQP